MTKEMEFHRGIDIVAPFRHVSVAPDDLTITYAENNPNIHPFGRFLVVETKGGFRINLCHYQELLVLAGDVKREQPIGLVGHSGATTGNHIHFQVCPSGSPSRTAIDPLEYFGVRRLLMSRRDGVDSDLVPDILDALDKTKDSLASVVDLIMKTT